jgi:hypothetical protein
MSEVKLNLVDARQTLVGTVHGSIADACVAALSAEPETIAELEAALARLREADKSIQSFWIVSTTGRNRYRTLGRRGSK